MTDSRRVECRMETIDGQPVRVRGTGPLSDADKAALAEVLRAAIAQRNETTCSARHEQPPLTTPKGRIMERPSLICRLPIGHEGEHVAAGWEMSRAPRWEAAS